MTSIRRIDWTKDRQAAGGLGNTVLYRMVKENLCHEDVDTIKYKMLVIGRVYSASVTRGAGKKNEMIEDGLYTHLAKCIKKRGKTLDKKIAECNNFERINILNLWKIAELHLYLDQLIIKSILSWRDEKNSRDLNTRISFVSKYLHFHAPRAFFIFDSIVQKRLRECGYKGQRAIWPKSNFKPRTKYARHCIRLLRYVEEKKYGSDWTPRLVDGHLMGYIKINKPKIKARK